MNMQGKSRSDLSPHLYFCNTDPFSCLVKPTMLTIKKMLPEKNFQELQNLDVGLIYFKGLSPLAFNSI